MSCENCRLLELQNSELLTALRDIHREATIHDLSPHLAGRIREISSVAAKYLPQCEHFNAGTIKPAHCAVCYPETRKTEIAVSGWPKDADKRNELVERAKGCTANGGGWHNTGIRNGKTFCLDCRDYF